ncbi:MAG: hypothetical protein ACI8TQ_003114 [Planctomycetota bacterium]|jgi:uncharacterized protein YbjQ (UPF0145 family)
MILTTIGSIPGREISSVVGLVRGSTVRARHVGKDILAAFKNVVGGEIDDYTKLMAEAREQALDRMTDEARARGADAIIGLRFATSSISSGAAEIVVYGTAVTIKK